MKRLRIRNSNKFRLYNRNVDYFGDIVGFTLTKDKDGWERVNYFCKKISPSA